MKDVTFFGGSSVCNWACNMSHVMRSKQLLLQVVWHLFQHGNWEGPKAASAFAHKTHFPTKSPTTQPSSLILTPLICDCRLPLGINTDLQMVGSPAHLPLELKNFTAGLKATYRDGETGTCMVKSESVTGGNAGTGEPCGTDHNAPILVTVTRRELLRSFRLRLRLRTIRTLDKRN